MSRVPEMTNALLREIKKAIPDVQKIASKTEDWDEDDVIKYIASENDVEVHTAFKMLIEAVIGEK